MIKDLILQQIELEKPESMVHELAILRESVQKICLSSLEDSGFFKEGAFHGGTALRILRGNPRFSEDLDFSLKKPRQNFSWEKYGSSLCAEFLRQGLKLEVKDRTRVKNVRTLFVKEHSLGKLLSLTHPIHPNQKITVKLEVDINPPAGATTEILYIDFPIRKPILSYDLGTSFAGKLHALLCREYVKGRDWFDFSWYAGNKTPPNFAYLKNALRQAGPWEGQDLKIDHHWLVENVNAKIALIDWDSSKKELSSFLVGTEFKNLDRWWGKDYFIQKIKELEKVL